MKKRFFVITETFNDNNSVTLIFKGVDEEDAMEQWESFYKENGYDVNEYGEFMTSDGISIGHNGCEECTPQEAKVLVKFCSKMY